MKKRLITATLALVFLFIGCSSGPNNKDIQNLIQDNLRSEMQQQIDQLTAASEALGQDVTEYAKLLGLDLPNPEDVFVNLESSQDLNKLENGDYTAKVAFTVQLQGKEGQSSEMTVQVRMTEAEGKWKALSIEEL